MRLSVVVALSVAVCRPMITTAQPLSPVERQVADRVAANPGEQIDFLERTVNINSGTLNPDGVRAVGRLYAEELESLGFDIRWIDLPDSLHRGPHLFAYHPGSGKGNRILLIGHLDTVFEPDDAFQTFERSDSVGRGPGANDMKGGNAVIVFALKALHEAGALDDATITVALMGDEEKPGKPVSVSRAALVEAAANHDVALGFETATGFGWATVARRGSSGWRLEVTGRRSHSSGMFSEGTGAGAVFETARILDAFYSYVRGEEFLTFNPGVILGGTDVTFDPGEGRGTAFGKTNVVASRVVVDGGLRFISEEQLASARERMRQIVETGNLPQTGATITFADSYPSMPPTDGNMALLGVLDQVSRDLGFGPVEAWDPGKRGAADISFVADQVDAMGGLGVMGSGAHTPRETIDLTTLPALTQRAALLIYRVSRQPR